MSIDFLSLNIADWVVAAFFLLMLMVGIARGVGDVAVSLMVWGGAFAGAQIAAIFLSIPLSDFIQDPDLLRLFPFVSIFIFLLVVFNLLFSLVTFNTGKKPVAKLFGGLLSIPLILILLLIFINFAQLLTLDQSSYWIESQFIPVLQILQSYWEVYVLDNLCRLIVGRLCIPA